MGEGKDHGKDEDGQENRRIVAEKKQVSQSKSSGTHLLGMFPIANTIFAKVHILTSTQIHPLTLEM